MDKLKTILSKIKVPKLKVPKISMPKIKIPKIKIPKISKPNFKPLLDKLKPYMSKMWLVIKKACLLALKALKGFASWLGKAIKESIAQVWTLLGFFIAWLTLTGTAQQIVGIATIFATILWLVTIPLREEKEE
jgi:hypothetical protein